MDALNGPHGPTDPEEQGLDDDSEIADVQALSSIPATNSSPRAGANRQTGVVDSGAYIHIWSDSAPPQTFESTQASGLHIQSASGHTVPAERAAMVSLDFGKGKRQYVLAHVLKGNRTCLFSMDKLASMGFDFDLTNQAGRQSYMTCVATGERMVLRRQHPEKNEGFWLIDLLFDGERGQGRVLNSIEDQGQADAVNFVDHDGNIKVTLPHQAQVLSGDVAADIDPVQLQKAIDAHDEGELDFGLDFQACLLVSSLSNGVAVREHEWKGRATSDHHLDDDVAKHVFGSVIPRARSDATTDHDVEQVMNLVHTRTDTLGETSGADEREFEHGTAGSVSEDERSDTRKRRKRPRARSHSINGTPLHQALCHPTSRRFDKWERCADGFPNRITHAARCTCAGCHSGKLRKRAVARERKALNALLRPATSWSFDISRSWEPDLWGNTAFVLFVDDSTSFIYVYPIKNHSDFYDVAARHVKYVRSRHGVNIEKMSADYDPTWSSTNTRDFNPDTAAGLDFQSEYALELKRSPPHTQAMNYAESVMGRIMAMANQQLITAHLAPKAFWWCAVRNAAIIHNLGPVESNRPLLQGDTTPYEAMTGRRTDVSSIIAPFGALCWIKVMSSSLLSTHGTKPSQLKPVSEPAIYLGTAEGAAGWTVLRLSQVGNARKTLTVTYHLTPILDMSARPSILMKHDHLLGGGALSAGPTIFNQAIRDLFRDQTGVENTLIVFSPLTGQPVALKQMIEVETQTPLLEPETTDDGGQVEEDDDARMHRGRANARDRRSKLRHRASKLSDEGDAEATSEPEPNTSSATPVIKLGMQRLEHNARARMRKLPLDTKVELTQENPYARGSRTFDRYQIYRKATTLGQYYELGARKNVDLPRDFARDYLKMSVANAALIVDPALALLASINTDSAAEACKVRPSKIDLTVSILAMQAAKAPKPAPVSYEPHPDPNARDYGTEFTEYMQSSAEFDHEMGSEERIPMHAAPALNPRAAAFEPAAATPPTPLKPGGVHSVGVADQDETGHEASNLDPTRLKPGGVREALIAISEEIRGNEDPVATATEITEKYTSRIDAALAALTPQDLPFDIGDGLVLAAMEHGLFKGVSSESLRDPTTYKEYTEAPDRKDFQVSTYDEVYQLLETYDTLEHCSIDDVRKAKRDGYNTRIVPSKVVYKRKLRKDGTIERHKSRWCACEAKGRFTVENTFSPAISIESVRLLFVLAAINDMDVTTLDVKGAYLVGDRPDDEDVIYIRMPPGMEDIQKERAERGLPYDPRLEYTDDEGRPMFYRVKHNLYGLQSAGAVFYRYAKAWLVDELGFTPTTVDPCIFWKRTEKGLCLVGLYVDDMCVFTPCEDVKREFMEQFSKKFEQSPEPDDDSFLSIAYRREGRNIYLNTPKLWKSLENLTSKHDLPKARGAPLPTNAFELLAEEVSATNPRVEKSECDVRAILGTAMWGVYAVRPAEALAVAAVARHVHQPTKNVKDVLLGLCAYLLEHKDDELPILPSEGTMPVTFVDSSWANDPITQRSWFGYCIMWAGCPFVFRAKLEPSVTVSTRDSEALGACFAIKAMLAVLIILSELGLTKESKHILPMPLYVDNQPVVDNTQTDRLHRDSRHMAIRIAWIREMVKNSLIDVRKIATKANVSDIFTKVLSPIEHTRFRSVLMGTATLASIGFVLNVFGT